MLPRAGRVAAATTAVLVVLGPIAPLYASVSAPKSETKYTGKTTEEKQLTLMTADRKTVKFIAFEFNCGRKTVAATSLQAIPLKRTDRGYTFKISAHGIVSYRDNRVDENGAISVSGRFSKTAGTVAGVSRVNTPRCHNSGPLEWRAKR